MARVVHLMYRSPGVVSGPFLVSSKRLFEQNNNVPMETGLYDAVEVVAKRQGAGEPRAEISHCIVRAHNRRLPLVISIDGARSKKNYDRGRITLVDN